MKSSNMKSQNVRIVTVTLIVTLTYLTLYLLTCNALKPTKEELEKTAELKRRDNEFEAALIAARSVFLTRKMYPSRPLFLKTLTRYSEIPYPLLVGPSMFFLSLFLIFIGYYIRKVVSKLLKGTAQMIDLYPETNSFPQVKLYSLQQSKREARLRREARNTWAWMANKYLLMPHDPNVKTTTVGTSWSDYDIPKDVWSIVRAVMKVNGLFQHLKKTNAAANTAADKQGKKGDIKGDKLKNKLMAVKALNTGNKPQPPPTNPVDDEKREAQDSSAPDEVPIAASVSNIHDKTPAE